ncbi:MAG: DUF6268 family outer membrane beta-barrel protein [Flammeovirgaceae bacterium]
MKWIFLVTAFAVANIVCAQEADTVEDYSMYGEAELAGGAKRFCTSKVFDLSPNKLISVGYDFQGGYGMQLGAVGMDAAQTATNQNNYGLRLAANAPVISKTNLILNLGATYWENFYSISNSANHPLAQSLQAYGLRTMGINFTLFKPFNEVNFLIVNGSADLNGNYSFENFQSLSTTKISATAIYGWKKHDRLQYGFGLARTYRIGELNYLPVFLYNYTFPSRKWGVEALFPARANLRRTFNSRTLAFFGYELEGNSYLIRNRGNEFAGFDNLELRRSELRLRLTFERSIKDFIWFSLQAGLRYNARFHVDSKEFFRGFGDQPYLFENTINNALYVNFSVNLVSP